MLTTAEIIKKVRELEIRSKKLATDLFTGEYHSAFKGRGMSFKEVREYAPGDDIRFIDWNVSARFGHPFSKVFEEERELTVMMLVDVSASSLFGTSASKKDIATEIAAVIAFSAISNGDKVGAILYSDKIEKYIPPRKGKQQALYIIRELLGVNPEGKRTRLASALRYFNNTTRQRSICFVLSDLVDSQYGQALKVVGRKHDLIGVRIYDKMDRYLPSLGMVRIEDAETGNEQWVDSDSAAVKYSYERSFFELVDFVKELFRKAGCDLLHVRTDDDYVQVLQRFFLSRNR